MWPFKTKNRFSELDIINAELSAIEHKKEFILTIRNNAFQQWKDMSVRSLSYKQAYEEAIRNKVKYSDVKKSYYDLYNKCLLLEARYQAMDEILNIAF